ncbi:MAG TPA: CxxxxCH/CxxCH domain-containing protein [Bacteroidota bacterium]|nr:CxxxxCH/CxxCH domain-containing protein [Bacteroidota bacterium]
MRIQGTVLAVLSLAGVFVLYGCSELNTPGPNPVTPGSLVHPTGWNDTTGHGATHGDALQKVNWDATSCKSCHGGNYGGGSSGVSCYTCHPSSPHDVKFGPAPNGHGIYLKAAHYVSTECKLCHGNAYSGGNVNVSCYSCHNSFPHEIRFASSAGGHMAYLQAMGFNSTECQQCHGINYSGGAVNVACFSCHDAYPHSVKFSQPSGNHVAYFQANGYPIQQCQACHGTDYAGGTSSISCSGGQCHATATGVAKSPEACNTCHGDFRAAASDTASWAPPTTISGDSSTTVRGVGAHQLHLRGTGPNISFKVPCSGCHTVPPSISSPGHLTNQGPAPVVITVARAFTPSDGLTPTPAYDPSTQRCSGTYCHGAWRLQRATSTFDQSFFTDSVMVGSFASPKWNGGDAEAACGTCHGLPPQGHASYPITQCYACHSGVINASGNIIDRTKHMNGLIDVYGQQLPMK